ncbi:MAG: V-type proton ATPase subunit E [Oscillospiraceae bacterium]|nr:V-type proton ATPase subunit E [Oscillospiraceae bacterium]
MTDREKLDIFNKTVLNEAMADSKRITEQFEKAVETATKQAEDAIDLEVQKYEVAKRAEITARERRRIRSEKNDRHHKLLEFREDCAGETYKTVTEYIDEFIKTDKYPDYLVRILTGAAKRLPDNTPAEIYLRPEDMHLSGYLIDKVPGISMSFNKGTFSLGGMWLSAPQLKLRIDMSFDSAMSDIIGHFSELSGMIPE